LTAIFDSCHSGTLLGAYPPTYHALTHRAADLEHDECNAVYVPWVSKGERKSRTLWDARRECPPPYVTPPADYTGRIAQGGIMQSGARARPRAGCSQA
jgi:hypothetical protein